MPFGGLDRQPRAPARRRRRPAAVAGGARRGARSRTSGRGCRRRSRATYGEALATAERDAAAIERLCAETGEQDPVIVPELDGDVHDVDGLVAVHAHLFRRVAGPAQKNVSCSSGSRVGGSGARLGGRAAARRAAARRAASWPRSASASAAQVGVQVPAEDVAQQRAQVAGQLGRERLELRVDGQAGDDAALDRGRVRDPLARAARGRAARRRASPGGSPSSPEAGPSGSSSARSASSRSDSASAAAGRSHAELEAAQRPRDLPVPRRAARDEAQERPQLVLLLGRDDDLAVGDRRDAERERLPRAAAGARPGERAERELRAVVELQAEQQPAQAHARVAERRLVPGAGSQRRTASACGPSSPRDRRARREPRRTRRARTSVRPSPTGTSSEASSRPSSGDDDDRLDAPVARRRARGRGTRASKRSSVNDEVAGVLEARARGSSAAPRRRARGRRAGRARPARRARPPGARSRRARARRAGSSGAARARRCAGG